MRRLLPLTTAFLLAAGPALAHTGHPQGGFASGLLHPFTGPDHLLAMVAVGLWAGSAFPRAALPTPLWAWPGAFAACTLGGFLYAAAGGLLPGAEALILVSVVSLGLAAALRWRAPVALGSALIGLFALAHGFAHGAEIPPGAQPVAFALGMTAATVLLHGLGLAAALTARRLNLQLLGRAAGLGIAAGGLAMALAS